jgi:DNA-binding response OmpR family regulator
MANRSTVAIINSSDEIVETLQLILDEEGFHTVGAHVIDFKKGKRDFVIFCQEYNPQIILFDVSPPYEENWTFLQLLRHTKEAAGRQFVITTTNKAVLEKLVGKTDAIEIVGKPFDMEEIVATVKKKLKAA